MASVRIVLTSHDLLFLDVLALRLDAEADFAVVETATSVMSTAQRLSALTPDVAVVDLDMGDDALALVRRVHDDHPATAVVAISSRGDATATAAALRAGAVGFVTRSSRSAELVSAVRGAVAGETWVHPKILTGVLAELERRETTRSDHSRRLGALTRRELEVLEHLVAGVNQRSIATGMDLSEHTVRTHVKNIFAKLGVHSRVDAIRAAVLAGLQPRDDVTPRAG